MLEHKQCYQVAQYFWAKEKIRFQYFHQFYLNYFQVLISLLYPTEFAKQAHGHEWVSFLQNKIDLAKFWAKFG